MEKLFELDPYLTHFTARVQSCVQSRKGWDVVLDQTAFYPEGGGQPYDLGTLGGASILEVHERAVWSTPVTARWSPAPRWRGTLTGPAAST